MKKSAFVTGSTGFLGLNLIDQLLKCGWNVYALHRSTSDLTYLNRKDVIGVIGDVTDFDSLEAGVPEDIDIVFHAAANTDYWKRKNNIQTKVNVNGTKNIVDIVLKKGISRLVYTSSITAYGEHRSVIDEETPSNALESVANYFVTKKQSEDIVQEAIDKFDLDAVILCPSHILGPYDFRNWVKIIHLVNENKLPGIPSGKGPFSHVSEVAQAHIIAADKAPKGSRYVLGGRYHSFLEVINSIQEILKRNKSKAATLQWILHLGVHLHGFLGLMNRSKEPELTREKLMLVSSDFQVDDSKAQQELGFRHIPIDEILDDCISWLKSEGMISPVDSLDDIQSKTIG